MRGGENEMVWIIRILFLFICTGLGYLLIGKDVLNHLDTPSVKKALDTFSKMTTYLLITDFPEVDQNKYKRFDGIFNNYNYCIAPFDLKNKIPTYHANHIKGYIIPFTLYIF